MLQRLGFVDPVKFSFWVHKYDHLLLPETWNEKVIVNSGRYSMWFGVGVNLGFKNTFFNGYPIDQGLKKRCDQFLPGFNSLLLYRYDPGSELKVHVDREVFDPKVVIINMSQDDIFGQGSTKFIYGGDHHLLKNGEVIQIDSRVKHGVFRVDQVRYSLSLRVV